MKNYLYFNNENNNFNIYFTKHYFTQRAHTNKHINQTRYIKDLSIENIKDIIFNHLDKMVNKIGRYLFSFNTNDTTNEKAFVIVVIEEASQRQPYDYELIVVTSVIINTEIAKFRNFGVNRFHIEDITLEEILFNNHKKGIKTLIGNIENTLEKYFEFEKDYVSLIKDKKGLIVHTEKLLDIYTENFEKIKFYEHYKTIYNAFDTLFKLLNIKYKYKVLNKFTKEKPESILKTVEPKKIIKRRGVLIKKKKIDFNLNDTNVFDIEYLENIFINKR